MKTLKYIIWTIIILAAVFYIIPAALLQVPYYQKKIAEITTNYLGKKIESQVQIERIEFQPFNKLILKNVFLEDQNGDTLLIAKRIAVGFDFFPLFRQRFHFSSAEIYTFTLNLNKETTDSPLNIQYIIDAFQPEKKEVTSNIDVNIKNLALANGNFSYRVKDTEVTPEKFNPNDILLTHITAKIKVEELKNESLKTDIKRLSFIEQSGLQIKQLAFDLAANPDNANINLFQLELPQSKIQFTNISADLTPMQPEDNFIEKTVFNLTIAPSSFHLKDISAIAPVFLYFQNTFQIEGLFYGTLDDMNLQDVILKDNRDIFIWTNANVQNLNSSNIRDIYVNAQIQESYISSQGIQKLANNFSPEPIELPNPVKNLGRVALDGKTFGHLHNLTTYLNINTKIGKLRVDANFGNGQTRTINGQISSPKINIQKLMDNNDFGNAEFQINFNGSFDNTNDFRGNINALINQFEYKSYNYENIALIGDLTNNSFKGILNANGTNGQLIADGLFVFNRANSEFKFSAKVENLRLDKLHLTSKYQEPQLSFNLDANFRGNNLDNMVGNLAVRQFQFSTTKGTYGINRILIESLQGKNERILTIDSDILTGKLEGNYSLATLIPSLKQTISTYLPSLIQANSRFSNTNENNFRLDISINDTRKFSSIFELPVTLYDQSQINGEYDNIDKKFQLNAHFPLANFSGSLMENFALDLNNRNEQIDLKVAGTSLQKKDNKLIIATHFSAFNDSIYSSIEWRDNQDLKYKGKLDLATQMTLPNRENQLAVFVHIKPAQLIFNDSIWKLAPANIQFIDGRLSIDNFNLAHNEQFVKMKGTISHNEEDEFSVALNKVNLDYIFNSLNIKALTFGGIATGNVSVKDVYNTRKLSTNLDVIDFSFNDVIFGHLDLLGLWDDANQGVVMKGNIVKDDSTYVNVDGIIYPVTEELSILFDANNTDAAFLRKYLDNVVQNLSGNVTGKLRLFGDLNNPTVEGDAWVKEGRFSVEFLNSEYTFTDWVKCTPTQIAINNITFKDRYGNKAQGTGYVNHKQFDDFEFSASLAYENFLIYNADYLSNPVFYGRVFGTGNATIRGTEDLVFIDVSMNNTANSQIMLNFMEEADIMDFNFINFVNRRQDSIPESSIEQTIYSVLAEQFVPNDIRLNLNLNVNTGATIDMIMDPRSGDKITAVGNGNMRIEYGTKTEPRVFGNYTIERGRYNFSLQQVLFRNFEIEDGSTVAFRGDPFMAELDIKAAYTVTANLGDLDRRILELNVSARNNIPVNCILLISGPLQQPVINFDLALPGATAELERQVKSYIRTDDMMNRQIVYLLVLGRFYTSPEYARSDSRFNNDLSFLTSTLSTQISNMLGNISDNFQVGTKFHQTSEGNGTSTEVELLLSSTLLNNRLIINGNFGYIDNPHFQHRNRNVPLVGDFDIEYKLTPIGDIRLRGFNHYNYRNYYSSIPEMTQGFGIIFRRDFNIVRDLLFRRNRVPFSN
jgi:hypothetical protein